MSDIEIEIQVKIEDSKKLLDFLEKSAKFQSEKRQVDEYLSPTHLHRDFISIRPVKEWLRLRDVNGKYSINYKNWHYDKDGKSHYCDEYETKIEDSVKMKKIFDALDFRPIVMVDKLRKTWTYKDYEIAIDLVKGLGDFVEIEYIGEDKNVEPKKITDKMIGFLKNLDCGKIEINYQGYPFLLLFPDEARHEVQ